jgi:transcriptional regulator with XRE-family HTH domain
LSKNQIILNQQVEQTSNKVVRKMNYDKLRELRVSRKIPLQEMADAIGLKTAGGYLRIETGENKLDAKHLPVIAKKFNMDLNELTNEIFFEDKVEQTSNFDTRSA